MTKIPTSPVEMNWIEEKIIIKARNRFKSLLAIEFDESTSGRMENRAIATNKVSANGGLNAK